MNELNRIAVQGYGNGPVPVEETAEQAIGGGRRH